MLLLLTWLLVFLLVALPVHATGVWLRRRGETDPGVLIAAPLVACGIAAYAAFGLFFLHPVAGKVFSYGVMVGSGWFVWRDRRNFSTGVGSWRIPALLVLAIGLFHLALLYLPELGREPEWQAQGRFLYEFPMDANLPKLLGDRLYDGVSPKPFLPDAGWLSSDRPPLQAGFYLLVRPWLELAHLPVGLGYQCIGTLVQLFWVPAFWLAGRRLGLAPRPTAAVILLTAASGFALFNGTYVWPKLLAGAYTLMAAGLLLRAAATPTRFSAAVAGAAAALAWLAHGGAAFSLGTLVLVLVVPRWFPGWKNTAAAAGVLALLVLPWTAYQKAYDPPGNRLVKWHLAGVVPIDARPVFQTVGDEYDALAHDTLVANKRANFKTLFYGDFKSALDVFTTPARQRRVEEFFYVFRSLGILNLAWVLAPLAWLVRRRLPSGFEPQVFLLAWTAATLVAWPLLMFIPGSTILHQGSYAMVLSLFLLAIVFLLQLPRWLGIPVLVWHVLGFGLTWVVYYKSAPLEGTMFVLMALAAGLAGFTLRRSLRSG
ncbi:MAG: hypothetical protein JWM88_3089 [Verrucomicrobia bacterium]|nr:hypothetical protein [Verrucomicrobiota bacterium]